MPNTLTSLGLLSLAIAGAATCTGIAADGAGYYPVGLVFGLILLGLGLKQGSPKQVATAQQSAPSPRYMVLGGLTVLLVPVVLYLIFGYAPQEATMGLAQKIFYFHVPSAYAMYIGFGTALVGSVGYLWKRTAAFDALAVAGAEVGLLFSLVVLITGPLWAREAWGTYWTWDARLTTTLLAALIFTGAVVLRSFGTGEAEKRFAAGLAIVGTFLVPIINQSVQRWRGQHPTVITARGGGLHPDMYPAFFVSLFFFTLLVTYLIWTRFKLERDRHALLGLESEAAELGLLEDA
jgi:heme exporter protein C